MAEQSDRRRFFGTTRKLAASLATVATATGLMVFPHVGAFDSRSDPFPYSVIPTAG